jgi:hypothetical protein
VALGRLLSEICIVAFAQKPDRVQTDETKWACALNAPKKRAQPP